MTTINLISLIAILTFFSSPSWSCIDTQFAKLKCVEYSPDQSVHEFEISNFKSTSKSLSYFDIDEQTQFNQRIPLNIVSSDGYEVTMSCSNNILVIRTSIDGVSAQSYLKFKENGFSEEGFEVDQVKRCNPSMSESECKAAPFKVVLNPIKIECTKTK